MIFYTVNKDTQMYFAGIKLTSNVSANITCLYTDIEYNIDTVIGAYPTQ